jgi:colicin import membrane protein
MPFHPVLSLIQVAAKVVSAISPFVALKEGADRVDSAMGDQKKALDEHAAQAAVDRRDKTKVRETKKVTEAKVRKEGKAGVKKQQAERRKHEREMEQAQALHAKEQATADKQGQRVMQQDVARLDLRDANAVREHGGAVQADRRVENAGHRKRKREHEQRAERTEVTVVRKMAAGEKEHQAHRRNELDQGLQDQKAAQKDHKVANKSFVEYQRIRSEMAVDDKSTAMSSEESSKLARAANMAVAQIQSREEKAEVMHELTVDLMNHVANEEIATATSKQGNDKDVVSADHEGQRGLDDYLAGLTIDALGDMYENLQDDEFLANVFSQQDPPSTPEERAQLKDMIFQNAQDTRERVNTALQERQEQGASSAVGMGAN